jgi:Domain of unknown function (DUF5063)
MVIQDSYFDAVNRFGLLAQQYCALVDSRSTLDKSEFLLQIYRILPELIAEAMRLPLVKFGDDESGEQEVAISQLRTKIEMKQEERQQLHLSLGDKLGDWDVYWEIYDPRTDEGAVSGSLADDIADIYQDLKDGIGLQETNEEVPGNEIIFAWRFGFTSHWGQHAVSALRTIHFRLEGTL